MTRVPTRPVDTPSHLLTMCLLVYVQVVPGIENYNDIEIATTKCLVVTAHHANALQDHVAAHHGSVLCLGTLAGGP